MFDCYIKRGTKLYKCYIYIGFIVIVQMGFSTLGAAKNTHCTFKSYTEHVGHSYYIR